MRIIRFRLKLCVMQVSQIIPMQIYDGEDLPQGLFKQYFGIEPESCQRLTGAGSNRAYYKLSGGDKVGIAVCVDNLVEGEAFIQLSGLFRRYNVNVPEVFAVSEDSRWCLQEYLGDRDLLSYIKDGAGDGYFTPVMKNLTRMQTIPATEWEPLIGFKPLGDRLIKWDLNYFKYSYLKPSAVEFNEESLEDDFDLLAKNILSIPMSHWGFMMRDCQSRNVMVKNGTPYFIDYQGGRKGPCIYDAVSFAWQAKAGFSYETRDRLLESWAEEFGSIRGISSKELLLYLPCIILFRLLQVMGAYGFRGLVEHKAHFIESIPPALENMREIMRRGYLDNYPELKRVIEILVEDERFKPGNKSGLRVIINSFSYKKGYPENFTGNGGGFMFDCRWMHNPGRYDEYKKLTGLDRGVREFLEKRGEVQGFVATALEMCVPAVKTYMRRGFSSLQIGFGCTGGQHRSVYCADVVGKYLAEKFPEVEVQIIHREQGMIEVINEKFLATNINKPEI